MDVANETDENVILVTLDPVSSLDLDTYIGIRPKNVTFWINAYIEETWCDQSLGKIPVLGSVASVVFARLSSGNKNNYIASVGGKWGHEASADHNLEFKIDNRQNIDHGSAVQLFTSAANSMEKSASQLLNEHIKTEAK